MGAHISALRPLVRLTAALALAVAVPAAGASALGHRPVANHGRVDEERIRSYAIEMVLRRDASMRVQETIVYDFGAGRRPGITRDIPVHYPFDAQQRRVYPVDHVRASSPSGAPHELEIFEGPTMSLRIGDPDREVTGIQTYVLSYDVHGVVNSLPDHQELSWNPVGDQWAVPVSEARVTVEGPGRIEDARCSRGTRGSVDVCEQRLDPTGAVTFTAHELGARQGMTVIASFPAGTFPGAQPILEPVWSPGQAFTVDAATLGVTGVVLLLLVGGVLGAVATRGRDERYLAADPVPTTPQRTGAVARVPLRRREPVHERPEPPASLRPGQMGTLLDERANVVDVTATIVDLAVRGFLRIEEVAGAQGGPPRDWQLVRLGSDPAGEGPEGAAEEELRDYERTLLSSLFQNGDTVRVSDLKSFLRSGLLRVQARLYEDVTRCGWFRGNPSSVRLRWYVQGALVLLAGAGLTWMLAAWSTWGLVGAGVVLGGLVVLGLAHRMPARTAEGTAVLADARGFRLYLERAGTQELAGRAPQDAFSRHLPYAVVFGLAQRWADVHAELAAAGVPVPEPRWYVGASPDQGFWSGDLRSSLTVFTMMTSGSVAAATPSASGDGGFGDA